MNVEPRWKAPARKKKRRIIPAVVREDVFDRTRGRCEFVYDGHRCIYPPQHLHHVRRRSQGGTDTPENLLGLCRDHHQWVHEHVAEAVELGYLAKTSFDPAPGLINVERVK